MITAAIASEVELSGFAVIEEVLSTREVEGLKDALDQIAPNRSVLKRGGVFAVRNLLDVSAVRELANSSAIRELVEPVLGPHCVPVRGILFDKIPDANWKVPWHQDVTIAVQERAETEGFGPWSTKSGVLHVQPPASILERMLSIRLHLDRCNEENGALRVISGTHLAGRIPEGEISHVCERHPEVVCTVGSGGALLMRPLLLHASSPSSAPEHRRVIHLDFASISLPNGLHWLCEK